MTTVTEPPLIDEPSIGVDDMPALDQPDERVCQLLLWSGERCGRPAAWIVSGRCPFDGTDTVLLCDACKRYCTDPADPARCDHCHGPIRITWIEAL